jgi:hypothetical protein
VIPEPLFTRVGYEALLETLYADLAPLDPAGTLRREWVNARGCIARFDRMALEIRLLDMQECPRADLAIAAAVSLVVRSLCDPAPAHQGRLRGLETHALARLLRAVASAAEAAKIDDRDYLRALGLPDTPRTAGEIWRELVERDMRSEPSAAEHLPVLERLLEEGSLARRILRSAGTTPSREELRSLYQKLGDCLRKGHLFHAAA